MCNCNFVPMMMCCNCGGNATNNDNSSYKETILYDGIINKVGTFNLQDRVEGYNDICIIHECDNSQYRQCLTIPVSMLSDSNMVCHGNSVTSAYIRFNIVGTAIETSEATGSYQIVKIIGRKY